jgi:predicted cupin superfamily sugar epimerase
MKDIEAIISNLDLKPHPEGGFFRETYRSEGYVTEKNLGGTYKGNRNYSTCIYFLLTSDAFSAFHRIKQDEIWHFYDGSVLCLHMISPAGEYSTVLIGRDIENGQVPQFVVLGGYWFGATVGAGYSLVGCTVSPGFDFIDFELANRPELVCRFPKLTDIITQLTR